MPRIVGDRPKIAFARNEPLRATETIAGVSIPSQRGDLRVAYRSNPKEIRSVQ
jgi:hypothetical protein